MELKVANSDATLLNAGSIYRRLLVRVCVRLYLRVRAFACACTCVSIRLRERAFACACVYAWVFAGMTTIWSNRVGVTELE